MGSQDQGQESLGTEAGVKKPQLASFVFSCYCFLILNSETSASRGTSEHLQHKAGTLRGVSNQIIVTVTGLFPFSKGQVCIRKPESWEQV